MAFPQNRTELEEALKEKLVLLEAIDALIMVVKAGIPSSIGQRREANEILLQKLQAIKEETLLIRNALQGLLDGWQQWDLDTEKEYFCVMTSEAEFVVVAEYLPDGFGVCVSEKEWTAYLEETRAKRLAHPAMLPEKVSYIWLVKPFADIYTEPCPKCGELQPVIQKSTLEEPLADLFGICFSCHNVYRQEE